MAWASAGAGAAQGGLGATDDRQGRRSGAAAGQDAQARNSGSTASRCSRRQGRTDRIHRAVEEAVIAACCPFRFSARRRGAAQAGREARQSCSAGYPSPLRGETARQKTTRETCEGGEARMANAAAAPLAAGAANPATAPIPAVRWLEVAAAAAEADDRRRCGSIRRRPPGAAGRFSHQRRCNPGRGFIGNRSASPDCGPRWRNDGRGLHGGWPPDRDVRSGSHVENLGRRNRR